MSAKDVLNKIENVPSEDILEIIGNKIQNSNNLTSVGFLNQHAFNLISSNKHIEKYFYNIDILLRDGIGIKLANMMFGIKNSDNLNGTDLIPQIIKTTKPLNVDYFVFGTTEPWLELGANKLIGSLNSTKVLDGFRPIEDYLTFLKKNIDDEKTNIIILAMGMPKQEELAFAIKKSIKGKGLIICGGAIIDFNAGRITRAPIFFRKLSLEWLYRLIMEPRRLFKRYVVGIPLFFVNLYRSK